MLERPPCAAVDDGQYEWNKADEVAQSNERRRGELPIGLRDPRIRARMLVHPDKGAHHEYGDDQGNEREIAETNAQKDSKASHGGGFHVLGRDPGFRLFVTISHETGSLWLK